MMEILKLLGAGFALMYATWFFYLMAMNLIKARDAGKLNGWAYGFGLPMVIVGVLMDVALNVFVGTVLFLELPQIDKLLFTARLGKHCGTQGWRGSVAHWICMNLLDPFDARGKHCDCDPK
jgi:hypothetical protein